MLFRLAGELAPADGLAGLGLADAHLQGRAWTGLQVVVERHDAAHFRLAEVEHVRHVVLLFAADVAVLGDDGAQSPQNAADEVAVAQGDVAGGLGFDHEPTVLRTAV